MDVATVLRQARRRKGWSQRRLAEVSGLPQSTVGRIESGAVVPRVDTLVHLLRACDEGLEVMPLLGQGIDRSIIRELLRLTVEERARLAEEAAASLASFPRKERSGG